MKRRDSRWLLSCAVLASLCLAGTFLVALLYAEGSATDSGNVNELPAVSATPIMQTATAGIVATAPDRGVTMQVASPLPIWQAAASATPLSDNQAFIGGAGQMLTAEAVAKSTQVEGYRELVRATWTAAALTMEPLVADMTRTAAAWKR